MEFLFLMMVRDLLLVLAVMGIMFHSLTLKNARIGRVIEEKMLREFGIKKKVVHWLEKNRMALHERLFKNKMYHFAAIVCLLFIVLQTMRISASYLSLEKLDRGFFPVGEIPLPELPLPR